jgi:tetratricopeptide (TPR) repeat protein
VGAGDRRGAARADAVAGRALRGLFRLDEARERLTAALEVLREDPDESTANALAQLGALRLYGADPQAWETTAEALRLAEDVGADDGTVCYLLTIHALAMHDAGRSVEATALLRHAAWIAERTGDSTNRANALMNLCFVVAARDPQAALDAARASVEHCRRVGALVLLGVAIANLADSYIWVGEWDEAAAVLADAELPVNGTDGLWEEISAAVPAALLAALRGDPAAGDTVASLLARTPPDDAVSLAQLAAVDALIAEAQGRTEDALEACRRAHHLATFRTQADFMNWSWPVGARAAFALHDADALQGLLALLDGTPVGQIPPLLRAERDIARARLASDDDPDRAGALFADGVRGLRAFGSPYHLAQGLLDHAETLLAHDDPGAADTAAPLIAEATEIAERLGAVPLAARAARISRLSAAPIGSAT